MPIGTTSARVAAVQALLRIVKHASKARIFTNNTHNEPPKTPVYSYHCTAQGSSAKPFPSVSHGKESAGAWVYRYSPAIHAVINIMYEIAFETLFDAI
jgi:hypothetical protein